MFKLYENMQNKTKYILNSFYGKNNFIRQSLQPIENSMHLVVYQNKSY